MSDIKIQKGVDVSKNEEGFQSSNNFKEEMKKGRTALINENFSNADDKTKQTLNKVM